MWSSVGSKKESTGTVGPKYSVRDAGKASSGSRPSPGAPGVDVPGLRCTDAAHGGLDAGPGGVVGDDRGGEHIVGLDLIACVCPMSVLR